ncbi:unnamed protein product [Amoebophrya sp. A25]|nr:unnamed protein product [Amoebophrya sp. A25]|eukprot:GSA25T00014313001.1
MGSMEESSRSAGDYARYWESFRAAVPRQRARLNDEHNAGSSGGTEPARHQNGDGSAGASQANNHYGGSSSSTSTSGRNKAGTGGAIAGATEWDFYRLGGEEDFSLNLDPVIFLPPESSSIEVFFLLIDALAAKGYKCIAAQHPSSIYTMEDFVAGFGLFLDHIQARRCHLFGAGLGGYLAQTYATKSPRRVASLMLCNTFSETPYSSMGLGTGMVLGLLPTTALQGIVLRNHMLHAGTPEAALEVEDGNLDPKLGPLMKKRNFNRRCVREAEAWVENSLERLPPELLTSKVTLAYAAAALGRPKTEDYRVLLLESLDFKEYVPTAPDGSQQLRKRHPFAKVAEQKYGGYYPFLSSAEETTIFIEVHLRNCDYFPSFDSPISKQMVRPRAPHAVAEMAPFALSPQDAEASNSSHGGLGVPEDSGTGMVPFGGITSGLGSEQIGSGFQHEAKDDRKPDDMIVDEEVVLDRPAGVEGMHTRSIPDHSTPSPDARRASSPEFFAIHSEDEAEDTAPVTYPCSSPTLGPAATEPASKSSSCSTNVEPPSMAKSTRKKACVGQLAAVGQQSTDDKERNDNIKPSSSASSSREKPVIMDVASFIASVEQDSPRASAVQAHADPSPVLTPLPEPILTSTVEGDPKSKSKSKKKRAKK